MRHLLPGLTAQLCESLAHSHTQLVHAELRLQDLVLDW